MIGVAEAVSSEWPRYAYGAALGMGPERIAQFELAS